MAAYSYIVHTCTHAALAASGGKMEERTYAVSATPLLHIASLYRDCLAWHVDIHIVIIIGVTIAPCRHLSSMGRFMYGGCLVSVMADMNACCWWRLLWRGGRRIFNACCSNSAYFMAFIGM